MERRLRKFDRMDSMQAKWGIAIGAAVSAGAYVLSMVLADPVSTALVFMAMFGTVVSFGLVVVVGLNAWKEGRWWFLTKRLARHVFRRQPRRNEDGRPCTSCHKTMSEVKFTWVCESCDHISVLV